jgi:hypothetical protein
MTTIKRSLLAFFAIAGLLSNANSARAQQSVELIMDNFTSSVVSQTNTLINNAAIESSMRNAHSKSGAKVNNTKADLSYTPSRQLQQRTVKDLGAKLSSRNAAAGQAFENTLGPGKTDYSQLFAQMVKDSGLPANNAATALAAYLEIGYMIVNDVRANGAITAAMDRALQQQAAGILGQNKALTSQSAIAKLGEELKLQAVVLYLGWQSSLKTPQIGQFRTGIAQQFKALGLDLSQVNLTTRGFVKK